MQDIRLKAAFAAVDYLTVTATGNEESAKLIDTLYRQQRPSYWFETSNKEWHWMGYNGRQYPGIRYGIRGTEAIVMLSGPEANEMWMEVAPTRSKCTRIDLAVTCEIEGEAQNLAAMSYGVIEGDLNKRSSVVINSRGGQTLYVGSRQSMYFGRVYDKGAEQHGEPGKVWRYEVECKKPASDAVVSRLLDCSDLASFISDYVYSWFDSRGVPVLPFGRSGESAIELETIARTEDRTLQWLRTQVAKSVGRLVVAGKEKEVREALNLPLIGIQSTFKEIK